MACKTILLVDDDVDFLATHQAVLEAAGFEVIIAHDSNEAMTVVLGGVERIENAVECGSIHAASIVCDFEARVKARVG